MKNSIKMLITITAISMYGMNVKAQNANTGIYLTEQDYKSNKLTYALGDHDRLHLNSFFDGKNINLAYQGKKVKLSKNEIFGYRLNNQDFRFYHNEAYRILDTTGFLLYSAEKLTQQTKGYKAVEQYFYSTNTTQPVLELTIENLWNSFPAQTGFRYSLQNYFYKNGDLAGYDKLSHQYKIKYLYFQQTQAKATHAAL